MGASARTLDINLRMVGGDAVQSGFNKVRQSARGAAADLEHAGESAEGLSHSTIFGLGELSRGIGRIAESGQASGLAMRELSGGIMRLGASLGPGAGLIGIIAILGGVIVEHFMKAREEMKKTEEQFATSLGNMANAGQSTQLQRQTRDLLYGTPYDKNGQLQNPSAVSGAFQGSLVDLRSRIAMLTEQTRGLIRGGVLDTGQFAALDELIARAKPLEEQYQRLTTAILNVANQPAEKSSLLGMKITAARPLSAAESEAMDKKLQEMLRKNDFPGRDRRDQLNALGVQTTGGLGVGDPLGFIHTASQLLGGKGPKADALFPPTATEQIIAAFQKNVQEPLARAIKDGFATTIGSAITDGITAGFDTHSIGGAFKSAGKAILAGMGGILEQMGSVWIQYGIAMTSLGDALWNPFTSGPAAIAIGAALVALGASLGAVSHGSSGGGYGGGSSALPSIVTTTYLTTGSNAGAQGATVTPQKPQTYNITLLGDDPASVRKLQAMLDRNARLSGRP